ncbi:MAG: helix-turn-helix transcriptional regulator [Bacteroidota bacterium]|nr:helix-turn-helix transcriptional regulator [Bacteroidota bacterium]
MSKEKDILVKIGNYIGKKAALKFKSNVEFANVCDINETSIRRILQGKQNMSIKVLKRVCEALDMKMSDLLKEIDN